MTQLVKHFQPNSMQILSQYICACCALNQSHAVQITIVQRNVNYQTMILQVSFKSSSIICTANDTISSEFPFEQHANPLTIYLRMITLSINQLTVQVTIVQRNVNYQTMILQVSY